MSEKSSAIITVSSKGQIAIPKELRIAVGLEAGSKVLIEYHKNTIRFLYLPCNSRCNQFLILENKIKSSKATLATMTQFRVSLRKKIIGQNSRDFS